MNIDILDVVVLDEGIKYVVVSKVCRNNKKYYQLAKINNPKDSMVCYLDNNEFVEIHDKELIDLLMPLFLNNLSNRLKDVNM